MALSRFEGQLALVAGGGHGMGRAIARRLGQEGARIAVVDVNESSANETAALLATEGITAGTWVADASDLAQVSHVVEAILDRFKQIDVLVSTAGVLIPGTVLTHTLEEWEHTYAVNVGSVFAL